MYVTSFRSPKTRWVFVGFFIDKLSLGEKMVDVYFTWLALTVNCSTFVKVALSSDNSKYYILARSVGKTGTDLDIVGTRISKEILWSEELYASMLVNFSVFDFC